MHDTVSAKVYHEHFQNHEHVKQLPPKCFTITIKTLARPVHEGNDDAAHQHHDHVAVEADEGTGVGVTTLIKFGRSRAELYELDVQA